MRSCEYRLVRPSGYEIQYVCACGWASDVVESDRLGVIGAQLVKHGKEAR